MSVPDDAIERTRIAATETGRYQNTGRDLASLRRAEADALVRRFAESLRAAGRQPLRAKRLRLTYSPHKTRHLRPPFIRTECAWTEEMLDVGEAWPVQGEQWTELVPDIGEGSPPSNPGRDIYAGVVYLTGERRLAQAVFTGLTVQRTGNEWLGGREEPSFADMLAQREATLRVIETIGEGDGCYYCRHHAAPAWRLPVDQALLHAPRRVVVEDLPGGGTRVVDPTPGTISYDDLLAPEVTMLTKNLVSARVPWAPAAD